jgi:hypothetical protein
MQYRILELSEIHEKSGFSFWQSHIWQNILLQSWQAREVFYFWDIQWPLLLVEIRSVWFGQFAAFSLWVQSRQVSWDFRTLVTELSIVLKEKWCIFYQIEPIEPIVWINKSHFLYKNFLTPHTRLLDITQSEDELLSQMHEKGRYNIRLAQKRWVTIEHVHCNDMNLDIWMNLLTETTDRDGFAHNSRTYYDAFLRKIIDAWVGSFMFAYYNGTVIAAMIAIYLPERSIYYYWASKTDKEVRKHMAPYLLQWEAIRESKKRNIPLYDFLWVADPNDKNDSLKSVSEFKEKFGWYIQKLPEKACFIVSWKAVIFLTLRHFFR